mgnify:FL=1|tara:strand:- start:4382 stop:5158 length:777 start_codon:yes stop_codon:yes gene_type:complete
MSNLRDFLYGYGAGTAVEPSELLVYNTSTGGRANGGQCCCWIVPAGKTYAVFEMWSGGGSGAGACCCQMGGGAGSGGYAVKSVNVTPGDWFTICAAGSGVCTDPSWKTGCEGCSSYICQNGVSSGTSWKLCLCGGRNANVETRCNYHGNCYSCCSSCYCCGGRVGCSDSNATPDLHYAGRNGTAHVNQYCYGEGYQHTSAAPMTAGGFRLGPGFCRSWHADCGCGQFPGGGGLTANKYDSQCCGGEAGGGGMIYVMFY